MSCIGKTPYLQYHKKHPLPWATPAAKGKPKTYITE
jgi:hypothetical protein